jgi:hypothetical protein
MIDSWYRFQRKSHSSSPPFSRAVQETKLLRFAGILLNKMILLGFMLPDYVENRVVLTYARSL